MILADHDAPLRAEEAALATSATRRREVALGRAALRDALGVDVAIGRDDRGAPVLPAGWVGSISHKGTWAAAIVAAAGDGFVGVDLEAAAAPRAEIGRRILTANEPQVTGERLTLVFAIKEAVYKAIDPIVRRYVGFQEVELDFEEQVVRVATALPVVVEAWWTAHEGHWLATARARPR